VALRAGPPFRSAVACILANEGSVGYPNSAPPYPCFRSAGGVNTLSNDDSYNVALLAKLVFFYSAALFLSSR
jgi:hypothetical protein